MCIKRLYGTLTTVTKKTQLTLSHRVEANDYSQNSNSHVCHPVTFPHHVVQRAAVERILHLVGVERYKCCC